MWWISSGLGVAYGHVLRGLSRTTRSSRALIGWLFAYFLVRPRSLLTGEAAKRLGSRVGLARTDSAACRGWL